MEIRKMLFRKEMKLVTLLLTALLIGTASAAVYYSLEMTSTITTQKNAVYFVRGTDWSTAGLVISSDNKSATLSSLKAYANMTMTYDNATLVWNNSTSSNTVRLRPVSLSGTAANFVFINFTLQSSPRTSLNYTVSGGNWNTPSETPFVTLSPRTGYRIVIETKAATAALPNQIATIKIAVDVQP
jgi:hypothetical protein